MIHMTLGTQDKDFFPKNIMDKFTFIKAMGFDCYEIDGKLLVENTNKIKEAIKKTGLKVSSACGGYRGWIGDFIEERRLNAIQDISIILEKLNEVGATGIVIPAAWGMFTYRLPPMVSPRSKEGDQIALLDSLEKLDVIACRYHEKIYLEPLNRYQDHMINTLNDATTLIEIGRFTNVKIAGDFYHMSIEEDDLSESLYRYQKYLGHIHVAENHRYQPGTGSVNFKRHFGTLQKIGYSGAVIIECRVRGNNPSEEYQKSEHYLRTCWEHA